MSNLSVLHTVLCRFPAAAAASDAAYRWTARLCFGVDFATRWTGRPERTTVRLNRATPYLIASSGPTTMAPMLPHYPLACIVRGDCSRVYACLPVTQCRHEARLTYAMVSKDRFGRR